MKKILSFLAAGALALGLIGCSGDLHDVSNEPYSASEYVYVLGGISSSKIDSDVYPKSDFADTKAYKVPVKDGKISFEFVYSGNDSWSAGAGRTAFAIVADISKDWAAANKCRWLSDGDIAVGTTGTLSQGSSTNVFLSGLSAGTTYKFTAELTAAGGTLKLEEGLAAVPFELIWVEEGKLTNAVSITAVSETEFSYIITPADKAKEYEFICRYGNTYYYPSEKKTFDVDGNTASAPSHSDSEDFKTVAVTIPSKETADKEHLSGYKVKITTEAGSATFAIEKVKASLPYTLTTVFGTFCGCPITWDNGKDFGSGNNGKPYTNKKVYTGTAVLSKNSKDDWGTGDAGRAFGVLTKDNEWSVKYTGAFLAEEGKEYELINGATFNNLLKLKELTSDITFTLKYTVYEGTFSNGSYSDETGSFTISYTGTGVKAVEPTYPPKWISGSTGDIELTWSDDNTATTTIDFAADYKDWWNQVENEPSLDTYTFGLKLYSTSWFNAYKEGAIKLNDKEAVELKEGAAGGNNILTSDTALAGKKVKLTFTYTPESKAVTCKAESVK
ncbi:MAG: hypothetical protein SPK26_14780 [Treponema sp.]|nr:hypothetical protein [Treponema sp.]